MATITLTGISESLRSSMYGMNTELEAASSDVDTLEAKTALQAVASGTLTITIGEGKNLVITSLPTADPEVAGALWADSLAVKVSAGPGE